VDTTEDAARALAAVEYAHVLHLVAETSWAITPEMMAVVAEVLAYRLSGARWSRDEIAARIGSTARTPVRAGAARAGSVAVLPLQGVITRRASLFSDSSGMVSLEGYLDKIRKAHADETVGALVLAIDSPGGAATGVHEAAAELRSLRGTKPIVAVADGMAASAAYWLAAQADELVVTPSGQVGSVGVYTIHRDLSRALDQQGITASVIKAGRYKAEGNPFEPLGDEARAAIQDQVNATYDLFVGDIAQGRGVPIAAVRDGYGEGRSVPAAKAKALGMADRVATLGETIARLQGRKPAPSPQSAPPPGRAADHDLRLARLRRAALS